MSDKPLRSDWEQLLDEAALALEQVRHHEALQLCDRAAQLGAEARYHAAILRGDVLLDLGDASGALSSYETVADPEVLDPELDCARGVALFELGRLAEAENALRSAIRGKPDLAEAYYALGLVAELLGSGQEVEYFRRARKLDPERFPAHVQSPREEFEAAVEQAIEQLPAPIRQALEDIPVIIAELPHPEDLKVAEPPLSPMSLGMFVRSAASVGSAFVEEPELEQPVMVLFKRNLERAAVDREQLLEEIAHTITHELGHALGFSEEELEES